MLYPLNVVIYVYSQIFEFCFSNAGYKNRRQYGKSPKNQLSVVLPIFYQSTQEHELNRAMVLATLYFQSASDKCSLS